jgi:hypothetical protein
MCASCQSASSSSARRASHSCCSDRHCSTRSRWKLARKTVSDDALASDELLLLLLSFAAAAISPGTAANNAI